MLRPATALGLLLLTVLHLSVLASTVPAATFTVDSTADAVDAVPGDSICATATAVCSLRAAVQEANATAGADTISVAAGVYLLTLSGSDDIAATGDLDLTEDVTIVGAGSDVTQVSAVPAIRVFELIGPVTVAMTDVAIVGGDATFGAGINASDAGSVLSLTDVKIVSNHASSTGGGLSIAGMLSMLRGEVFSNSAGTGGGGAALVNADIRDSTFRSNVTPDGSVDSDDIIGAGVGTITATNSTFTGIVATLSFCLPPPFPDCTAGPGLNLRNVTAEEVQVYNYGGVSHGPTMIRNSIVLACGGLVVSEGYNLFETSDCFISGDLTGNIVDTPALLHPLGDYGGPTETRPPMALSPAVDAGNPATPGGGGTACDTSDQRQAVRPEGVSCDMGAVETRCGDGAMQTEEECDDGNAINGDGCDNNCTTTGCGNSVVSPGETCDDGNTDDGDCCSSSCLLDVVGTACTDDGNDCTTDFCDGLGSCIYSNVAAGTSCSDANLCTSDEICDGAGTCSGTFCDSCYNCDAFLGCVFPDVCDELLPEKAKIKLKQGSTDEKDQLRVSWKAGFLDKLDFPNVGSGTLQVCVYDGNDEIVFSGMAFDACTSTGDCWTDLSNGFRYKDKNRLPDGLAKMKLKAGNSSRMTASGKGIDLDLAVFPLVTPVRLRAFRALYNNCVAADFTTDQTNSPDQFKAKVP